jgi:8-oxo-dGTP pyrophosphatase MutT (NUDIX family)
MEFICVCGKCQITKKSVVTDSNYDWSKNPQGLKRSGTFIYHEDKNDIFYPNGKSVPTHRKYILLVQTYNGKWGPPKGTIENNESSFQCAVRETREETGIDMEKNINPFMKKTLECDYKCDMFPIPLDTRVEINPKSYNEITGYGWVSMGCVLRNRMLLNRVCHLALKEFMDVEVWISIQDIKKHRKQTSYTRTR